MSILKVCPCDPVDVEAKQQAGYLAGLVMIHIKHAFSTTKSFILETAFDAEAHPSIRTLALQGTLISPLQTQLPLQIDCCHFLGQIVLMSEECYKRGERTEVVMRLQLQAMLTASQPIVPAYARNHGSNSFKWSTT